MPRPVANTNKTPNRRPVPAPQVVRNPRRKQRDIRRDQPNMTEGLRDWFDTGDLPGLDGPSGSVPANSGFWPPGPLHEGSNRSRNHNSEFRQWSELEQRQYQPQPQIQHSPVPYVVHDNRTFIGNDWQCTSGDTPRISQTISSYYMGAPPQTPMSYRGSQTYQEQPGFHDYPVPFRTDQGAPDFQPFRNDQRVPPPQPPEDNNPPPYNYQQPSNSYPHYAQTRALSTRRRGIHKRHRPFMPDELDTVNVIQSPTRSQAAVVNYASESRSMNSREVSTLMPAPIAVCNEPTSREHFNILMSRLRSFSVDSNQENISQMSSCLPAAQRENRQGSAMAPHMEIMLSGKELFEKAKREDKTGKYDNCYWDDRMDCFVNKAAGNVGPFWKR